MKKIFKAQKNINHTAYKKRKSFFRKFGRKLGIAKTLKTKNFRRAEKGTRKYVSGKKHIGIELPKIISLDKQYRKDFLYSLAQIRKYLQDDSYHFSIDHSKIEKIEPEALLILAAEIKRSFTKTEKRYLAFSKKYAPKNTEVIRMLNSIGYWEHFEIPKAIKLDEKKRKFFKIHHDTQADFRHIVELREYFKKKLSFYETEDIEDVFDIAISEAVANAVEHAYIKEQETKTIKNGWWIAGSFDIEKRELFFGCYDQGVGVRESLQYNNNKIVSKWFESIKDKFKEDTDILEMLVEKELPKYKDVDRGHGFKQFIKLIQEYENGSLEVYSNYGLYKKVKSNDVIISDKDNYKDSIGGTLIVWKVKI